MIDVRCRFCNHVIEQTFVDLGMSPISNAFLSQEQLCRAEQFYPLRAYVCEACLLVQLQEFESREGLFANEYAYFSSYSDSWLRHAETYTDQMIERFDFDRASQVIELASNDGYLLQYFHKKGIPVLGIEPANNVARIAEAKGIPTLVKFFGANVALELVEEGTQADLLIGNNVLAHVPDLNDFVAGIKLLLKPNGILTMEFPHVLTLIRNNQFDTIYHEHFSYFSFLTVEKIFAAHGIVLFDVEELPTHGGSLRIYGRHDDQEMPPNTGRILHIKDAERKAGLHRMEIYHGFGESVKRTKRNLVNFLIGVKNKGRSIVGYGAPAKGNTLLNYCGIGTDYVDYTVDRSPHKQGLFLPGTHIPVYHPDRIWETRPDYVLILPWNLKAEIIEQMAGIHEWGGKFIVPIPEVGIV